MIETIITGDLGVNTYLFNFSDNKIVIVDPGSDEDKIIKKIEVLDLKPEAILLTHGHFDHIGAVKTIKSKYNIPVYIHSGDSVFLGDKGSQTHLEMFKSMGQNSDYFFNSYYVENDPADFIIKDGDILTDFSLEVIHTPGHSPGSVCFYSKDKQVLFTGDTMFKGGMGRTDFIGGNYNQLLNSLEKLKKLPIDTKVFPGHGDSSTIGRES
ncbi:MBL fold metallo-hydrolase [Thiospirochaeta perfilievii]|uniref:MBL fold metallo-hydrolase n=1 Tax=Thiospirochaeta perfilievii TaxID=252967 RepID=A0A5C1QCF7_9SPIO|nr:MBL fold metallo-hydrolase [Thiospirochaeta perfilievii]QEN05018.1 MBL fold metallo-hydrolase [Thiospirochaeta perfilievii]